MSAPTLEEERFNWLLEQLAGEWGYGWQSKLAELAGLHQTTFSKKGKGERPSTTTRTIGKVRDAIGLRPEYFTDQRLGSRPPYKRYLRAEPRVEADEDVKAALAELIATWDVEMMGTRATDEEIEWVNTKLDFRADRAAGLIVDARLIWGRIRDRRRQQAGKALERPKAELPTPRPGRVKLSPAQKPRRGR